jgi:hypothetical protein
MNTNGFEQLSTKSKKLKVTNQDSMIHLFQNENKRFQLIR